MRSIKSIESRMIEGEADSGLLAGDISLLASDGIWSEGGGVVRLTRADHPYGRVLISRGYTTHPEDSRLFLEPTPKPVPHWDYQMSCGCMRKDPVCRHWKEIS